MSTLFDTPNERHAFIIGLGEVICPWPARHQFWGEVHKAIINEYHYYTAGRACGFIALLVLLCMAKKLFWR